MQVEEEDHEEEETNWGRGGTTRDQGRRERMVDGYTRRDYDGRRDTMRDTVRRRRERRRRTARDGEETARDGGARQPLAHAERAALLGSAG